VKLSESAALRIFSPYGEKFARPNFLMVDKSEIGKVIAKLERIPGWKADIKFVVKANLAVGGKGKKGLVAVCERHDLDDTVSKLIAKSTPELFFDSVVVESFIDHQLEFFVSLKAVRDGIEVSFSESGGVEVESHWNEVNKIVISTEDLLNSIPLVSLKSLVADELIVQFLVDLLDFFQKEDATYLEINPFTVIKIGSVVKTGETWKDWKEGPSRLAPVILGIVLELDEAAGFRHKEWEKLEINNSNLNSNKTEREQKVADVDSKIKGSVKLVEVPHGGDTALMAAGAGAALYLADAIIYSGLKLANYAEFSGNPPSFAITELTKQICLIPGIKNLVIGSGIANFTPVKPNIEAIIEGLKASPQAKNIRIIVRRCGPGEEEGITLMKKLSEESGLDIQVFGRETGMTEIIKSIKSVAQ